MHSTHPASTDPSGVRTGKGVTNQIIRKQQGTCAVDQRPNCRVHGETGFLTDDRTVANLSDQGKGALLDTKQDGG